MKNSCIFIAFFLIGFLSSKLFPQTLENYSLNTVNQEIQNSLNEIILNLSINIKNIELRVNELGDNSLKTILNDRLKDINVNIEELKSHNTESRKKIETELTKLKGLIQKEIITPLEIENKMNYDKYQASLKDKFKELADIISKDILKVKELEKKNEELEKTIIELNIKLTDFDKTIIENGLLLKDIEALNNNKQLLLEKYEGSWYGIGLTCNFGFPLSSFDYDYVSDSNGFASEKTNHPFIGLISTVFIIRPLFWKNLKEYSIIVNIPLLELGYSGQDNSVKFNSVFNKYTSIGFGLGYQISKNALINFIINYTQTERAFEETYKGIKFPPNTVLDIKQLSPKTVSVISLLLGVTINTN